MKQTEELLYIGGVYKFMLFDEDGNIVGMREATKEEIEKAKDNAEEQASKLPLIDGEEPSRW